jgi:monothiol glutaredoxin
MDEQLKTKIENLIKSKKIFLFMKGTPEMPQCGFSAQVGDILKKHNADFGSFNVLEDNSIREGIKEYGNWPTIPQLYVDGKLIGGCDIILDLDAKGELKAKLE